MAEAVGIETRSRSRSKTPGLENGDSGKKSKKIPTISLIEEEEEVPSSQSARTKRPRRTKVDTSGDVSTDSPKNSQKIVVSSTTTITETVTKTVNGAEEATSTTVTKSSLNGDESQSIFNNIFNAIKTSTPILSSKKTKRVQQKVSPGPVNVAEHPAYKEYREAGEYWNKFPKTDYTYSELSPHRRELSNGMVAMPNMSRKSLDKYTARVETMIQNNPLDETFIRRKYLSNASSSFQKRSADLQYDSADEVDVSEFRRQLQERRRRNTNVVTRFLTVVTTFISAIYYRAASVFRSKESYAYTPVRQTKRGIVSSSFESIKRFFLLGFSRVYVFLSTILCLDTWILYTRSEKTAENRKRKRFLLFLLVLLPLLLFGGTYIYLDPPQNLSLPKLSLPKISLPSLPKLNFSWPSFSLPELSWPAWLTFSFTWPTISFEWLKFSWPQWLRWPEFSFSWPEISFSFAWLKFSRPEWLKFPDISLPSFTWPSFSLPSFTLPSISWPSISWPSISWPSISLPSFSLPSLPSFSFDFSPYTGYVGDKFDALKLSSSEFFGKIRDITLNLINEAQIVWSDNFNAVVSNAQPEIEIVTEAAPVIVETPPVVVDAI